MIRKKTVNITALTLSFSNNKVAICDTAVITATIPKDMLKDQPVNTFGLAEKKFVTINNEKTYGTKGTIFSKDILLRRLMISLSSHSHFYFLRQTAYFDARWTNHYVRIMATTPA